MFRDGRHGTLNKGIGMKKIAATIAALSLGATIGFACGGAYRSGPPHPPQPPPAEVPEANSADAPQPSHAGSSYGGGYGGKSAYGGGYGR